MAFGPLNALSERLLCLRGLRGQTAFQLGKESKQAAVLFPVRRRLGEPLPAAFLRLPLALEFQSALFFLAATAGGFLAFAFPAFQKRPSGDDGSRDLGENIADLLFFIFNPLLLAAFQIGGDSHAKESGGMQPGLVMVGPSRPRLTIRHLQRPVELLDNTAGNVMPFDAERHLAGHGGLYNVTAGCLYSSEYGELLPENATVTEATI